MIFFVEDSVLVGVTWEIPVAVLRATWQRGLPATFPWRLKIIGYTFIGRIELGLTHIKNIFQRRNKLN